MVSHLIGGREKRAPRAPLSTLLRVEVIAIEAYDLVTLLYCHPTLWAIISCARCPVLRQSVNNLLSNWKMGQHLRKLSNVLET